jgi:hypothetical protein
VRAAPNGDPCCIALRRSELVERGKQQLDVREAGCPICVGHEEPPSARVHHAVPHCATLSTIVLEPHDAYVRPCVTAGPELERGISCTVGGAVVDDEDLESAFRERREVLEGGGEHRWQTPGLIVGRYDDAEI